MKRHLIAIIISLLFTLNLYAALDIAGGMGFLLFNDTEITYDFEGQLYYRFLNIKGIDMGLGIIHMYNQKELSNNEEEIIWALPIVVNTQYPLVKDIFIKGMDLIGSLNVGASLTKLGLNYYDDILYMKYVGWRPYIDIGFMFYYNDRDGTGTYIKPGFRYLKSGEIKDYRTEGNNVYLNMFSPFITLGYTVGI
ncbi:MAG: hypothetical protein KKH98_10200 [Spirochaetes bacterium]|nr:hypothetical protein [Spirochaetota bacterium]